MQRFQHEITADDEVAMAAMRAEMDSLPEMGITPADRPLLDEIISATPFVKSNAYVEESSGKLRGWWCIPPEFSADAAILYLHGGGYVIGSAQAFRGPAGQISAQSGVQVFVPEYRLAPEYPFPAAFDDAIAAYDELVKRGISQIAIVGDSAGGGLALALTNFVATRRDLQPAAIAVVCPWTDLTMSGESFVSRALTDPMLNREKLSDAAAAYLHEADPRDPRASPIFGKADKLPPIQIHVGGDEVLLDDSVKYAELVDLIGSPVQLHVWVGMLHVFVFNTHFLDAARSAMNELGTFLREHISTT